MSKRPKWIIGIASLIALLAIAAPIYYYVKDFHGLQRSSNPPDWGSFGDFFGGILNPIISLLTLIVTIAIAVIIHKIDKRYHDEAVNSPVKPLFTIVSKHFFSADISAIGLSVEKDFYSYKPPQAPAGNNDYLEKLFHLKLSNKGLGVASVVVATFEINLTELRQLLTITHPNITVTPTAISTDEDGRDFIWLNVASTHFNFQGSIKIWSKENSGLGVIEQGEKVTAFVPSHIISAFKLYNLKRRLDIPVDDFPDIFVTLDYKNIHGKSLIAKFRVGLLHVHDYAAYGVFRVLREHILPFG